MGRMLSQCANSLHPSSIDSFNFLSLSKESPLHLPACLLSMHSPQSNCWSQTGHPCFRYGWPQKSHSEFCYDWHSFCS